MKTGKRIKLRKAKNGFTLVELVIVITILAILAAITIVGFGTWRARVAQTEVKSDLSNLQAAMEDTKNRTNQYPTAINPGTTFDGTNSTKSIFIQSQFVEATYQAGGGTYYCIDVKSKKEPTVRLFLDTRIRGATPQEGSCLGGLSAGGTNIQTISSANCPTYRTRTVDARDNHTYLVQKLADGRCWMLTNLAYAGGGLNTYGDVKALTDGTGSATVYTNPKYYVVPDTTNFTTEPTSPTASVDGTGQYGYLYNWCAAMGAQTSTSACTNTTTPAPSTSISICPNGWRLPTGSASGEFQALATALGVTNTSAGSAILRSNWMIQYSGSYSGGSFGGQDWHAYFWSATQTNATSVSGLYSSNGPFAMPSTSLSKQNGYAMRCVAV